LWRAGLSVARNCADGEEAIHEMSKESSKYSFTDTVTAANTTIDKPYKCETFEKFNPKGCEGCPHKGKITSPIQLGDKVIAEYESDSPEEEEPLPELPWPYMFAKNGGIYAQVEEEEPTLVYEHRLYLDKIYNQVF
jgi:hypothetical protein